MWFLWQKLAELKLNHCLYFFSISAVLHPNMQARFRIHQIRLHTKLNNHWYFKKFCIQNFQLKIADWITNYLLYLTVIIKLTSKGLKTKATMTNWITDANHHHKTECNKILRSKSKEQVSNTYREKEKKKNWAHLTCPTENKIMGIVKH